MSDLFKKLTWYKKIEVLRTMKGWNQREAAEECNTNQKGYWGWESGTFYPRKNNQIAIAKAFGVPVEEIFSEEREAN